jgi:flagellar biosynthesis/type III secretory pathway protein FliH
MPIERAPWLRRNQTWKELAKTVRERAAIIRETFPDDAGEVIAKAAEDAADQIERMNAGTAEDYARQKQKKHTEGFRRVIRTLRLEAEGKANP